MLCHTIARKAVRSGHKGADPPRLKVNVLLVVDFLAFSMMNHVLDPDVQLCLPCFPRTLLVFASDLMIMARNSPTPMVPSTRQLVAVPSLRYARLLCVGSSHGCWTATVTGTTCGPAKQQDFERARHWQYHQSKTNNILRHAKMQGGQLFSMFCKCAHFGRLVISNLWRLPFLSN